MLTFLFWNIRGRDLLPHIGALVDEHAVDVVVLAESEIPAKLLLRGLRSGGAEFLIRGSAAAPCQVAVRRAAGDLKLLESYSRYTFYRLTGDARPPLTLVALHAHSKRFYAPADQLSFACELRLDLRAVERRQRHRRTLMVGDFNMDPFEPAMVSTAGLHAVLSRDIAEQGSRIVDGRRHDFFFNPTWSLMGDPVLPGSYFLPRLAPGRVLLAHLRSGAPSTRSAAGLARRRRAADLDHPRRPPGHLEAPARW